MRPSRFLASASRLSSWPSSQAMRNWRPLIRTLTWAIALAALAVDHVADARDGSIDAAGDLAADAFEPARACCLAVERGGKLGTVDTERVQLAGEPFLAAVALTTTFHCRIERIERQRQALDRGIHCARLRHRLPRDKKMLRRQMLRPRSLRAGRPQRQRPDTSLSRCFRDPVHGSGIGTASH